jgi:hypothetical protein
MYYSSRYSILILKIWTAMLVCIKLSKNASAAQCTLDEKFNSISCDVEAHGGT